MSTAFYIQARFCHSGRTFYFEKEADLNIFETVRENIKVPDAAQFYGISDRNGYGNVRCIFHADNTPSMKLYDDHFHCFGCGAHGDVTDLTAQIYGLSKIEAARKLCSDFGISLEAPHPCGVWADTSKHPAFGISEYTVSPAPKKCRPLMTEREKIQLAFDVLTDYCAMLREFRTLYAPHDESAEADPRFIESLHRLNLAEYLWDSFAGLTDEERAAFITENSGQLRQFYDSLQANGRLRPSLTKFKGVSDEYAPQERTA